MPRNLISPAELKAKRQAMRQDAQAEKKEISREIGSLATQKGWKYAKAIADSILKEYECAPPKTDADKTKWEVYTHMKWAIDKLLYQVAQAQTMQDLTDSPRVVVKNADNRSSQFRTKPPDGAAPSGSSS